MILGTEIARRRGRDFLVKLVAESRNVETASGCAAVDAAAAATAENDVAASSYSAGAAAAAVADGVFGSKFRTRVKRAFVDVVRRRRRDEIVVAEFFLQGF